jgi:predicted dehydrogenase/threonine dehydrogenase-like Zn-dependent dehydrogenase
MNVLTKNNKSGELSIEDVPIPYLATGHVLVQNSYSAISIGTESSSIAIAEKNLLQKAKSRPEELKKVMDLVQRDGLMKTYKLVMDKLNLPTPLGYSSAGTVIGIGPGVTRFHVGDRVACGGSGHGEVITVPENLCVRVPDGVSLKAAAFTTIASIALQGVRQADVRLGEIVGVVGMGLIGLITSLLLKAAGCRPIGIDIDESKVRFAREMGIDCYARGDDSLFQILQGKTAGHGLDAVIIAASTGSNDPVEFSTKVLRDKGHITAIGAIKMAIPRKDFYEKELSFNISRSYGPGRYDVNYEQKGIDYPIGFVRWTENRNMEAIQNMLRKGDLDIDHLITHEFPFGDAVKAYGDLKNEGTNAIGVVLRYEEEQDHSKVKILKKRPSGSSQKIGSTLGIGMVGIGSYAQNALLPAILGNGKAELRAFASATGEKVTHFGKKFDVDFVTTDADELISDERINCIFIATRHNTHARYVLKGLEQDKHVYVEKPLALTIDEIDGIREALGSSKGSLMVGFNRRFSPIIQKGRKFFGGRSGQSGPLAVNYRINSGFVPADHWTNDPTIGGGRIIGEICHFGDLCNFLVGENDPKFTIAALTSDRTDVAVNNTVAITLKYRNGSVATIDYFANGSKSMRKERIEIFGRGKSAVIDDFTRSTFYSESGEEKYNLRHQDKGQTGEVNTYINSLMTGKEPPIPVEDILSISEMVIRLNEACLQG